LVVNVASAVGTAAVVVHDDYKFEAHFESVADALARIDLGSRTFVRAAVVRALGAATVGASMWASRTANRTHAAP
jgi:hypothetical protein